jgi:uncharacterized membrane protein
MEPDAANRSPSERQPDKRERETDLAHYETKSIILDVPVRDVYACCTQIEELPRFINSLQEVQKIDDTHFLLTSMMNDEPRRTVLQIILRVPERRLVWQAISDYFPRGVILFEALSERKTGITVKLRSNIEPMVLAKMTSDYLTNFKHFMEQGRGH